MKLATKLATLNWAESIDSLRIIPRTFLVACFMWAVGVTHELLHWYMAMPKEERSVEASGFASVVFLTVTGFLKLVYDRYAATSRDWSSMQQTTTVASVTTVEPK